MMETDYWQEEARRQLEYGRKRETERQKYLKNRDAEIGRDINRIMGQARNDTKMQMDRWLSTYTGGEDFSPSTLKQIANQSDIRELEKKAKEYVRMRWMESDKEGPFSPEANREMRRFNFGMKMNRGELLNKYLALAAEDAGIKVEDLVRAYLVEGAEEELMRQASLLGLNLPTPTELRERAEIIAGESFHEATFSSRIWDRQEELVKGLEQGITRTVLLGQHPNTWRAALHMLTDEGYEKAAYNQRRIAITEAGRVQISIQKDNFERAGYKQFVVICETTACPICKVHDGEVYELEELEQGRNAPMFHPFCRCSTSPRMSRRDLDYILGPEQPGDYAKIGPGKTQYQKRK